MCRTGTPAAPRAALAVTHMWPGTAHCCDGVLLGQAKPCWPNTAKHSRLRITASHQPMLPFAGQPGRRPCRNWRATNPPRLLPSALPPLLVAGGFHFYSKPACLEDSGAHQQTRSTPCSVTAPCSVTPRRLCHRPGASLLPWQRWLMDIGVCLPANHFLCQTCKCCSPLTTTVCGFGSWPCQITCQRLAPWPSTRSTLERFACVTSSSAVLCARVVCRNLLRAVVGGILCCLAG